MRILVVSQYFWPENFRINDLCLALKDRGHSVTVLTGEPNYPSGNVFDEYKKNKKAFESYHNIPIVRTPMLPRKKGNLRLVLNYLSFLTMGSLYGPVKLKNENFDVILVCQLSPVTAAIPAISLKFVKKLPIVMWSLDLWPESLAAVGVLKSDRALTVVGKLVSWIYRNCDTILGQSESYLKIVQRRCDEKTKLELFPNWAEDQFNINYDRKIKDTSFFTILFAGNIGDAQDFESIIECAKLIKSNKFKVVFSIVGNGRKFNWLKNEINKYNLTEHFILHGQHPLEMMPNFYRSADAALVSLKPNDIFGRTIPGKMQSYMLSSLPILAMLDGEGKDLVEEAKCGLSCSASDFSALFFNIKKMHAMSLSEKAKMGENGREYADMFFNKEKLIIRLEGMLKSASMRGTK